MMTISVEKGYDMSNAIETVKFISKGNKKLPSTTWIFNSGSATNCPSKKLGLCQCPGICYALKAEIQYPDVLPYRNSQYQVTKDVSPYEFAAGLLRASKRARKNKFESFRFNESGDFEDQAQLDWFVQVCTILKANGIVCYGYTARTDLDLSALAKVSGVNVSNDGGDWVSGHRCNRFKSVAKPSGDNYVCVGDCRICSVCTKTSGIVVEVENH